MGEGCADQPRDIFPGMQSTVAMDAAAPGEAMGFRNELREQEIRAYRGILKGMQEFAEGGYVDADEADRLIRKEKGWL